MVDDNLFRKEVSYLNFDDLIYQKACYDEYKIFKYEEENEKQKKIQMVDKIVEKYLTINEKILFRLAIDLDMRISDIMHIVGFNNFQSTENNINRIFRLIKCYVKYESLNKLKLVKELKEILTDFEFKILNHLHNRLTILEIKEKYNYLSYRKVNSIVKNIYNKLNDRGEICKEYYEFLIELRKFRQINQ